MALERIRIRLTAFEKIQALRDEEKLRTEELAEVESIIRDKLFMIERQRYLESLSPYYGSSVAMADIPSMDEIDQLEGKRSQLVSLLELIHVELPALLKKADAKDEEPVAASASQAAQAATPGSASQAAQARKVKFDSFEDFRKKQDG